MYAFQCPECGGSPDVLICDATAQSIQSRLCSGISIPSTDDNSISDCLRPHVRNERCLFPTWEHRSLFSRFTETVRGDGRTVAGHQSSAAPIDLSVD